MKKVFLLSALLVLIGGAAMADRATLDDTKTQIALPLETAPVIDGVINADEWLRATGTRNADFGNYWFIAYDDMLEDWTRGGDNPTTVTDGPLSAEDINIEMWVAYDADNLYVAVRVTDDILCSDSAEAESANGNTWEDDSVEIFVDGDNSNYPERDTSGSLADIVDTGGQYVITINNAYREAEAGNPGYGPEAAWYAQCTQTSDTSYDAEFRISLDTIGNPQEGDIIGFTICVNDDDTDDAEVDNQYTWTGATHEEVTYGNLILGVPTYTAPKTSAPTLDGVVNAGEYGDAEELVVDTITATYDVGPGDDEWPVGDCNFSAWIVYDDDAVYVGVSVTDDNIVADTAEAGSEDGSTWEDDAIEVFFDIDNTKDVGHPSTVVGDGQYAVTANGAHRDAEANNPTFGESGDWYAVATTTDAGYDIEYKFTRAILGSPADGASMGFTIGANDDDGEGRKAQLAWSGIAHNEASYGVLTLGGGTSVNEWSLY